MIAIGGPLEGLTVLEARAKAIEMLTLGGNIASTQERHQQEIPVSEREKPSWRSSY